MQKLERIAALVDAILSSPRKGRRLLVAVAGAPASGKSTLAQTLAGQLTAGGHNAAVVPMDGWHMSNDILRARGLLDRKGAPETFDVNGFRDLLRRVAHDDEVFFPVFDRTRDAAIVAGGVLTPQTDIAIVEGNYLLLDEPGWSDLAEIWDLSVMLATPVPVLRERLIARWLDHGLDPMAARRRAETNDIPNAERVVSGSLAAAIDFSGLVPVTSTSDPGHAP